MNTGKSRLLILCGASAAALTLALPAGAHAETAAAETTADAAPASETAAAGAVVVTARRRAERLQDVPVAVTALSSAELERRTIRQVDDLARIAPNLSIAQSARGAGVATIAMRGQENTNGAIYNDPAVGIYFDEVYLARTGGNLVSSLDDMSSVQVLRGPQGTLFGRNNTGGAILLTPNRPNLNDYHGAVTVNYGSYNHFEFMALANIPVVKGVFAVRGFYKITRQDGIGRSVTTGVDSYGDLHRDTARASARWTPTDNLTLDFTYDYLDIKETGPVIVQAAPFPGLGFYETRSGVASPASLVQSSGYTLHVEYNPSPDLHLKTIVGRRFLKTDSRGDFDAQPAAIVDVQQFLNQDQWTFEFQANGTAFRNSASWLNGVNYTGGLFYFTESGLDGSRQQLPVPANPDLANAVRESYGRNVSTAGYFQVETNHYDRLFLSLGTRYTQDQRYLTIRGLANGACSLLALPAGTSRDVCYQSGNSTFKYWSFEGGARYKVTPNVNLYFRYDRGQRAGGVANAPTVIYAFLPEVVSNFEFGVKSDLLDHHLIANVALFHADVENVQRASLAVDPVTKLTYSAIFNAGKTRVQGLELDVRARLPAGFSFEGSLGLLSNHYRRFIDPRPGATFGQDVSYLTPPDSPKTTYSVALIYETGVFDLGTLMARIDYGYRSTDENDVYNNKLQELPPVGLANARIQFNVTSGVLANHLSLALYGRNLGDKKYNVFSSGVSGGNLFRNSDRRAFGVELKVSY